MPSSTTSPLLQRPKNTRDCFLLCLALLPFLTLVSIHCTLWFNDDSIIHAAVYWETLLVLVIPLFGWAFHLRKGRPVVGWLLPLCILAIGWKCLMADWIIEVPYEYMGEQDIRSHVPPVSPMWSPPDTSGAPNDGGGWGGPTGPPRLRLAIELVLAKMCALIIGGYLLLHSTRLILIGVMKAFQVAAAAWVARREDIKAKANDGNSWP